MGFSPGTEFSDVVNTAYVQAAVTVGTSAVVAKVGATNLDGRQEILIYSKETNDVIYFGPTGVTTATGIPLQPGETANFPFGDAINLYLISASAGNSVIVQELS
jgi:hypothetical protein